MRHATWFIIESHSINDFSFWRMLLSCYSYDPPPTQRNVTQSQFHLNWFLTEQVKSSEVKLLIKNDRGEDSSFFVIVGTIPSHHCRWGSGNSNSIRCCCLFAVKDVAVAAAVAIDDNDDPAMLPAASYQYCTVPCRILHTRVPLLLLLLFLNISTISRLVGWLVGPYSRLSFVVSIYVTITFLLLCLYLYLYHYCCGCSYCCLIQPLRCCICCYWY